MEVQESFARGARECSLVGWCSADFEGGLEDRCSVTAVSGGGAEISVRQGAVLRMACLASAAGGGVQRWEDGQAGGGTE